MTMKRRFNNKKPKLLKKGGSIGSVKSLKGGGDMSLLNKYGFKPASPTLTPSDRLSQRYFDNFNRAKQLGNNAFFVDEEMYKVYSEDTPTASNPSSTSQSTNFDDLDFNSAFGKARGSNMKTFFWRGKEYGTQLKGENTGSKGNDKGDFNKAFASARKDGYDTFEWNGKIYGTRLRGESPLNKPKDQIKHRSYEEYTTSLDDPKVEEKTPVNNLVVRTKRFTPDIKEQDKVYTPTNIIDYLSGLYEKYASPIDDKIQTGVDYLSGLYEKYASPIDDKIQTAVELPKNMWLDFFSQPATPDQERVYDNEGNHIETRVYDNEGNHIETRVYNNEGNHIGTRVYDNEGNQIGVKIIRK